MAKDFKITKTDLPKGRGVFHALAGNIQFDEQIIAFDDFDGQLYLTTTTKMY